MSLPIKDYLKKDPRKNLIHILIILLIATSVMLFIVKSEKEVLQKNMDLAFTNAISDTMHGLGMDFDKMEVNNRIQYYYLAITNLKDALDLFHNTSYKEYDNLFQALLQLYSYWLPSDNGDYIIEDKLYIFEFLGKALVYPEDEKLITEFYNFIEQKDHLVN
ncbi:MAG: hypothetical protein K0S76_1855 [Herbinix sp.]|jgi:transcriptional regulator of heat shock response|nr:hypothetical protein [Herbinix sp.]